MEFSLISKVNHKIKGLLTIIQEGISIAREDTENATEKQKEFLNMSYDISKYLTIFVVDFMNFLKIKDEGNEVVFNYFSIGEVIDFSNSGEFAKKIILKNSGKSNMYGSSDLIKTAITKILKYVDKNSIGSEIAISFEEINDNTLRVLFSTEKFIASEKDFSACLKTYESEFSDNGELTGFELLLSNEILKLQGSQIKVNIQGEEIKELYFDAPCNA